MELIQNEWPRANAENNETLRLRPISKSYKNFNVSVFLPVSNVNQITDLEAFDKKFEHLYKNVKIGRVYIECYRSREWAPKEQVMKLKAYFEEKGILTSGALTPTGTRTEGRDGDVSLCYSRPEEAILLKQAVEWNAEMFDEMIFDDFYFLNCRCPECIKRKGSMTWPEFRKAEKRRVTEELVMKPAKAVNPNVNVIVKYPQWFEVFHELGYNLEMESAMFDSIYTGTETRNPLYSMQHLPKYLSYFTQRLYEAHAPGRNLGGWFDPFECTYSLNSYLEQAYLTLFAKAPEAMLFAMGPMIDSPDYRLFAPAVGEAFREMDEYLGLLGNPKGVAYYRPNNARGEDNIHSYFGMIGFPLEPFTVYPEQEKTILIAEGAAADPDILARISKSLTGGADVIVTSNFAKKMGRKFFDLAYMDVTDRKAYINDFTASREGGQLMGGLVGIFNSKQPILMPQIDFAVNDVWELAAGYGTDNNFPIILRTNYGEGRLAMVTVPDNYGDLYNYPTPVLDAIRRLSKTTMDVWFEGNSRIQLFAYDNQTFILRSDNDHSDRITVHVKPGAKKITELIHGSVYEGDTAEFMIQPGFNYVFKYE